VQEKSNLYRMEATAMSLAQDSPGTSRTGTWTATTVRGLGVTTDLTTAGEVLGISRNTAYQLAADGTWPTRLLRLGSRYRVPVAELLRALGLDPAADGSETGPSTGPASATTDPAACQGAESRAG